MFVIFVSITKLCNIKQICMQSIKGLHQQTVMSNSTMCEQTIVQGEKSADSAALQ